MKNKNHFNFGFVNNIFKEHRFVFVDPEQLHGIDSKSPEDKALSFIAVLHDKENIEGGDTPNVVLTNNPYADMITAFVKEFKEDDYTFTVKKHEEGHYILQFPSGEKPIDGLLYAAINWREIDAKLDDFFTGKNVPDSLMAIAAGQRNRDFEALVLAIANDPEHVDQALIDKAYVALEKLRPLLSKKAATERIKARGEAERTKAKPVQLPAKSVLKKDQFIELTESREEKKKLDLLRINVLREGHQINAEQWDHFSEAGLKQIYADCREVGIPVNDPYYKTMFAILNNGLNRSKNTYLSTNPEYQVYFQQPANHMKELMSLGALPTGFDPEAYAKAYEHMQYIQGILLKQDQFQTDTLAKQEEMDGDPASRKATDFLRSNYDAFTKAIRERDYATAGMYVAGIWAIYKSAKELGIFGKNGKGTKWMAYGLALYCGHIFAKNAGYDVLKLAGIRDADFEVKGTPLEAIDNILRANSGMREIAKDLDYGIVLRMSEASLVDLEELFQESNSKGVQFIHPYQFPNIFPELAKQWPFRMGVGEEGLSDYSGMSNTKLSTAQREYIRVGRQLYKMSLALRGVYDETLKKDHPNYKGQPYEKMIRTNVRGLGKVRHLLAAVYDYAPPKPDKKLGLTKTIDDAEEHLSIAFEGIEVGLYLDRQIEKSGHFEGKMMGYPVVFVRTGNAYRVYLKPDYKGPDMPGRDYIAEIPIETGSRQALEVRKAVDGVRGRILELMRPLYGAGGKRLIDSSLKYDHGAWTCEATLPGATEFKLESEKITATLVPYPDGKGVDLFAEGGVRISIDKNIEKQYPIALGLIRGIIDQPEYHALRVFNHARRLKIVDKVQGDKIVTLLIGKSEKKLDLRFDDTKFVPVDAAKEALVVQDLAADYTEALEADGLSELNKNVEALRKSITKVAPESFFLHFFEALAQETADSPLDGINLDLISGSVPDYFTSMILDVSKKEVYERMRYRIKSATSFKDIEDARQDVLHDFNARIQQIQINLEKKNAELAVAGKDWDADEFMREVIDPIRMSSSESGRYAQARADMEYRAYSLSLPGLAKKSDSSQLSHNVAGKVMGVFVYYTAHLDNHEFNSQPINLDNLSFPAVPTPGTSDPAKDPALRGHFALRYFQYVENRIFDKASAKDNITMIPDGSARDFWDIKDFEDWIRTEGDYRSLDPLDQKPAYTHDETHPGGSHTKFDQYIASRYDQTVSTLLRGYGDILNHNAISDYLRKGFRNPDGSIVPEHQIGLLTKYPKTNPATGAPLKDPADNIIKTCKLWDMSNRLNTQARGQRSAQIRLVENELNEFVKYIFTTKDGRGEYKFYRTSPSIRARLVRRWPWLHNLI